VSTGDRVREIMVGLGFSEVISYSFISPDSARLPRGGERQPSERLRHPAQSSQRGSVGHENIPHAGAFLRRPRPTFLTGRRTSCFRMGESVHPKDSDELPEERFSLTV